MKSLTTILLTLLMSMGAWSHGNSHSHPTYVPNKTTLCFDYNDGTTAGKLTQAIAILSEKNCDSFFYWGHYHLDNSGRPLGGNVSLNFESPIITSKESPVNTMDSSYIVFKEEQKGINVTFDKNFKSLKKDIEVLDKNSESIMEMSSRIEFLEVKLSKLEASIKNREKKIRENEKAEKELLIKKQKEEKSLLAKKKYEACLNEAKISNDLLKCTRIK